MVYGFRRNIDAIRPCDGSVGHFCQGEKAGVLQSTINRIAKVGSHVETSGLASVEASNKFKPMRCFDRCNFNHVNFDHDFDFDTDSELPRFENKLA
jgi:hypothetical protein